MFVIIFTAEVCMSRARRCSDWFFQKQDVMPGRGDSHIKRGMVVISLKRVQINIAEYGISESEILLRAV